MKLIKSVNFWMVVFGIGSALSAFGGKAEAAKIGVDGGGAGLSRSSNEQVKAMIEEVLNDVKGFSRDSRQVHNWVFWAVTVSPRIYIEHHKDEVSVIQCLVMPWVCMSPEELEYAIDNKIPRFHTAWDYLSLSKVVYEENGPCPAIDKTDAAASVSAYKVGATLCFSIPLIAQTPLVALKAQIASLLMHEMAHLRGYNEDIAEKVQNSVAINFPTLSKRDGRPLLVKMVLHLMDVDRAMWNAQNRAQDHQISRSTYFLGNAAGMLSVLQSMLPDGVDDNTIPVKQPERYEEISKEIKRLSNEMLSLSERSSSISIEQYNLEIDSLYVQLDAFAKVFKEYLGKI